MRVKILLDDNLNFNVNKVSKSQVLNFDEIDRYNEKGFVLRKFSKHSNGLYWLITDINYNKSERYFKLHIDKDVIRDRINELSDEIVREMEDFPTSG